MKLSMKMIAQLGFVFGLGTANLALFAQTSEVRGTSASGRQLVFTTGQEGFNRNTRLAQLCSDRSGDFAKVKLWMPEHGHGSSPTTLAKINDRCTTVDRLNFVMSGKWDFQISLTDGDTATLSVNID
jgi:hypothetical protein